MIKRSYGPLLVAGMLAIAVFAALLPTAPPVPRFAMVLPITYSAAALGYAATAIVLIATSRHSATRHATLILSLTFAVASILLVLSVLVYPSLPQVPAMIAAPRETGVWLYVFWHALAAAGTFAYIAVRRGDSAEAPSLRFTVASIAVAILLLAASATLSFAFSGRLPVVLTGTSLSGLGATGIGPLVAALLALAAFLAFRIRDPGPIDRALAYSMVALVLDMSLLLIGAHRFSASYFAGRLVLLSAALLVLISAIQVLVASRTRMRELEFELAHAARDSTQLAGRIQALWKIAADTSKSPQERFNGTLETATGALRRGKSMVGCLGHLDGETLTIDAVSSTPSESAAGDGSNAVYPGATFAIAETPQNVLYVDQRTRAWETSTAGIGHTDLLSRKAGWRSFIGTPVKIGLVTHFLTFASTEEFAGEPFTDDDIAYVDVVASFFAARFAQELQSDRVQFQIEHDALTGLKTRSQFRVAMRREITGGNPFAIAILDLDDFREINELRGHQFGDEILVEVASGLREVADGDLVARMSGDEFGFLLRGVRSAGDAVTSLGRYARRFALPFNTGERSRTELYSVAASIGAARFPDNGRTVEELMRRAAVALAAAKSHGGSTTTIFDAQMEATLETARLRRAELGEAIAHGQLALVYQPTFDLATRRIVGAEALVRWDHPERGRLAPAEFMWLAESHPLLHALTRWVVTRLIRDLSGCEPLPPGFRAYFNLGAETLEDFPFIAELNESLRAAPGLAEHIGVEITEIAAMRNVQSSMHTIERLRRWGLSVAIDDFGTGYSSLAYLSRLTVDTIKIDRGFVEALPADERVGVITEMLLRITERFGFASLAEGIETEAQAAWLLRHGCKLGQGYLVSKPIEFAAMLEMLDVRSSAA